MVEGVDVEEVLRCLHEGDAGVAKETKRLDQEILARRVVGIEDGDEIAAAELQRIVQVAGLGVGVVVAAQVAAAQLFGQPAHAVAAAVVQQPGFVRVVHPPGRQQRAAQQVNGLVISRHEHVDFQPGSRRLRFAHAEPVGHQDEQQPAQVAIHLRGIERDGQPRHGRIHRADPPDHIDEATGHVDGDKPGDIAFGQLGLHVGVRSVARC
ncbi:hypothetical protein D3C72_1148310 [compost metagenome]